VKAIVDMAKDRINEKKIFSNIVEGEAIVKRNYELMQLKSPSFPPSLQMQINMAVEKVYDYNKFQFVQQLTAHSMHTVIPNFHVWLQEVFYPLSVVEASK
jgi:hypothetical protein